MPKLPITTPKKLIRVLEKLGFFRAHSRGSHLFYVHPDGRKVSIPMHGKDIPKGTLLGMLKDLGISKEALKEALIEYL